MNAVMGWITWRNALWILSSFFTGLLFWFAGTGMLVLFWYFVTISADQELLMPAITNSKFAYLLLNVMLSGFIIGFPFWAFSSSGSKP